MEVSPSVPKYMTMLLACQLQDVPGIPGILQKRMHPVEAGRMCHCSISSDPSTSVVGEIPHDIGEKHGVHI